MVGEEEHALDAAVVRRAVRKIDRFLLPFMMIGYGITFYDKAILGSAALFGMTTDLSLIIPDATSSTTTPPALDSSRLSWATSIFYLGMVAGLYPMSFGFQRFDVGRLLGVVVVFWSGICMLTAAVTTYQQLYAQRFFLGFVESIIPVGLISLTSTFYTQSEQASRAAWWWTAPGFFVVIGGGLNYGFSNVRGGGLHPWQYIYLLAGVITFVFGLFCFMAPSSPVSARFLSQEEQFAAVERLRHGQTGVRCTKFKMAQVKEAVLDPKLWLLFIMMASCYTMNGAIIGFGPLIVNTFGWNTLESILLQWPVTGFALIAIMVVGVLGSRFPGIRIFMLMANCCVTMTGCAIVWKSEWTHHAAAPLIGYGLTGCYSGTSVLIVTLASSNVAGNTKKSFTSATIFVANCVGNIIGPLLVRSQTKTQHYPELWIALIVSQMVCMAAAAVLYLVLYRANRHKSGLLQNETERAKLAFQDLTDIQNPYFRYVL
ncbi:major facilitator superfamily domain-containing protein [Apodospora peruviana]|uniref:Major facilitator superfamily domain-containing protein n=1 Tax=Apodospora peruviana TaxID=516989 RepID=A0AAE0HYB5_9PEZI|nr:major facilitator superfamily domain-containing protein [Apodospora peruviana]